MNTYPLRVAPEGDATTYAEINPTYGQGASRADLVTRFTWGGHSHLSSITIFGVFDPVRCTVLAAEKFHEIATQQLALSETLLRAARTLELQQSDPVTHRRRGKGRLLSPVWR